jgi:hypothetical protein
VKPEQIEQMLRQTYGDAAVDEAKARGEVTEEQLEESRRVMFAYLAGLIRGKEREALGKLYYEAHKTHAGKRYLNCALCEQHAAMAALSIESPFLQRIKKSDFTGDHK